MFLHSTVQCHCDTLLYHTTTLQLTQLYLLLHLPCQEAEAEHMHTLTLIIHTPNLKAEPKQKMDLSAVSVSVQLPPAVAIGPTPRVVELPKAHKTPIPRPPLTPPAISYRFSHIFTLYTINFHACQTAIQATTPKPTQEQPRTCRTLHLVQFQATTHTLTANALFVAWKQCLHSGARTLHPLFPTL